MSERARGALFNALGDISGLSVLDAFAGSGALGLEAASRGASRVLCIDVDKKAHETINANIVGLHLDSIVGSIRANAASWSELNIDETFDVVLLDPPYDQVNVAHVEKISNHAVPGGIVVVSLPPDLDIDLGDNFKRIMKKSYGDATLAFFTRY